MLSDSSHEIRQQADSALSELLQEIKNSPVLSFLNDIFDTLLKAPSDPSDKVVLLVLEVHACIAKDPQHFHQLVVFLAHNFRIDNSLLEKRGALIIRRLCVLLDAERVYCKLSTILEGESDLDFASIMVQLLEPGRYIWLLTALYGLLMLLPQQSMAFTILRTRLNTVPSYSFTGNQFKRLSGSPYSQIEDGDMYEDLLNANGINFASRLQQFEQMQQQHRMHSKSQATVMLQFQFFNEGSAETGRTPAAFVRARHEPASFKIIT